MAADLIARHVAFAAVTTGLLAWASQAVAEVAEFYSPPYQLAGKYGSMEGPGALEDIQLVKTQAPELLWITGITAEVVDARHRAASPQLFCHANLDISPERHREIFGTTRFPNPRLFTLSQGLTEIRLPEGFGLPVMSDEPLTLYTQALNHNLAKLYTVVRVKVVVKFERASAGPNFTPLRVIPASGLVLTSSGDQHQHASAPEAEPGTDVGSLAYHDDDGRTYSGHWIVPPGKHTNKTRVTRGLDLDADTLVVYVAPHVHPFAQFVELKDLTTGSVVLRSNVHNLPKAIGLERVEPFQSTDGLVLKRSHDYELTSEYDNSTQSDQTAMSVLFMYARDDELLTRYRTLALDTQR